MKGKSLLSSMSNFWRNALFGRKKEEYPFKIPPYTAIDDDGVPYIDKQHLIIRIENKKRKEDEFYLIDVREKRELSEGVIETSKSIPCESFIHSNWLYFAHSFANERLHLCESMALQGARVAEALWIR